MMSIPSDKTLNLCWHAQARPDCRHQLTAALQPHNTRLVDEDVDEDTPGLLPLIDAGEHELAAVARLSRGGQRRLVVTLSKRSDEGPQLDWQLLALGASEVLSWSALLTDPAPLCARLQRWRAIDEIVSSPLIRENLIGSSPAWTALLRRVVEVARFTTAPILLLGESGTGKEMLARLIHTLDMRPDKSELIVADCTTVVPELSGSEFFGHERGAFTNAHSAREGAFALANRGTLFLDEVGELPITMQAQLLRVVQEQTFKKLGSNSWQQSKFRLICATNRDLWKEVEEGGFRRDLYYRLAGWVFKVPSLPERREDILPLARHFLAAFCPEIGAVEFGLAVAAWLQLRAYPGNIRDLRQLVLRIGTRHVGNGPIGLADIPEDERPCMTAPVLPWPDRQFEHAIERAVSLGIGLKEISRTASELAVQAAMRSHGSLRNAARNLGVSDRALQLRQANVRDARDGLN